jgi:hypothetical protein
MRATQHRRHSLELRITGLILSSDVNKLTQCYGGQVHLHTLKVLNRTIELSLQICMLISCPALKKRLSRTHLEGYTRNPELVSYNSTILQFYTEHRMTERIDQICENFKHMTRDEIRTQLVRMDNDQGGAMKVGEKKVTRPQKPHPWLPDLCNLAFLRLYWKLCLREAQHSANYSKTFARCQTNLRKFNLSFTFPHLDQPLPIDVIRSELNKEAKRFRECQKHLEYVHQKVQYGEVTFKS